MTVKFLIIKDTETDKNRTFKLNIDWGDKSDIEYLFSEGRLHCDSSRARLFYDDLGEDDSREAVGDSRYHVTIFGGGRLIYADDPMLKIA